MNRWGLALSAILLTTAHSASAAEGKPGSIERFVELITAGEDLAGTEYRDLISAEEAVQLRDLAQCEPGTPNLSGVGTSILILWDCSAHAGRRSLATTLGLRDGRVVDVTVLPAVAIRVRRRS